MSSPFGPPRFWTRERVLAALRRYADAHPGPLPCSDRLWNDVKRGHQEWPRSARVYEFFDSFADAWLAAGADETRITRQKLSWDAPFRDGMTHEAYLLERAGAEPLKDIAEALGRSPDACRRQLHLRGVRLRDIAKSA